MTELQLLLYVGKRVRLNRNLDLHPLGCFPAGLSGTITEVNLDAPAARPIAHVRFSVPIPPLAEWDNQLQLFRVHDRVSDATPECFDLVEVPV